MGKAITAVLYVIVEFLKAVGLEDFAMWFIIVLASIVGSVAAVFILSVVARWTYSRHPGEIWALILAVVLLAAATYAITQFGIWPVVKWLLLALAALAMLVALIVGIFLALESSAIWLSAIGAAATVAFCGLVAQLFVTWFALQNMISLVMVIAVTAALAGFAIGISQRKYILTLLLSAVLAAALLAWLSPATGLILVVRTSLSAAIVLVALSGGLLFGLARNKSPHVF